MLIVLTLRRRGERGYHPLFVDVDRSQRNRTRRPIPAAHTGYSADSATDAVRYEWEQQFSAGRCPDRHLELVERGRGRLAPCATDRCAQRGPAAGPTKGEGAAAAAGCAPPFTLDHIVGRECSAHDDDVEQYGDEPVQAQVVDEQCGAGTGRQREGQDYWQLSERGQEEAG